MLRFDDLLVGAVHGVYSDSLSGSRFADTVTCDMIYSMSICDLWFCAAKKGGRENAKGNGTYTEGGENILSSSGVKPEGLYQEYGGI